MTRVQPRRAKPTHHPILQAIIITEILVGALIGGVLGAVLIWG
jgi:type III secretory pathway component EscT